MAAVTSFVVDEADIEPVLADVQDVAGRTCLDCVRPDGPAQM